MTEMADARAMSRDESRWITDSRVYNLIWLGRWIERAQDHCEGRALGCPAGRLQRPARLGDRAGHGG